MISVRTVTLAALVCSACGDDGGSSVTVKLPNAPSAIVAYRDGSAEWTATTGADGDVRFAAPSGTYSVVIACNIDGQRQVRAYELTTAELSTIEFELECGAEQQMISGTFVNGSALGAYVYWGPQTFSGGQDNYRFSAPRGTGDLVASNRVGRVAIKRGLTLADSPLVADIDFNDPAALDVTTHMVIPDINGDERSVTTSLLTSGGTDTNPPFCVSAEPIACGISSSALAPGDLHVLWVQVVDRANNRYRSARWTTREVSDRVVHMAKASTSNPTVTAANQQGRVSFVAQLSTPAPLYRVIASQEVQPQVETTWELFVSQGRASNGLDITLPDLAGVAGWEPTFDLVAEQYVSWWIEMRDGSTLDEMLRRLPAQEGEMLTDGWMGAVVVAP